MTIISLAVILLVAESVVDLEVLLDPDVGRTGAGMSQRVEYDIARIKAEWPIRRALHELGIPISNGPRNRCPFCYHLQQTPELTFSYGDRGWTCFRCGEKGDVFKLFMVSEGITFKQALERLGEGTIRVGPRFTQPAEPDYDLPFPPSFFQDQQRDHLVLGLAIKRELDAEVAKLGMQRRQPPWLTHEDYMAEMHFAHERAQNRWDELDRSYVEICYHMNRINREWTLMASKEERSGKAHDHPGRREDGAGNPQESSCRLETGEN